MSAKRCWTTHSCLQGQPGTSLMWNLCAASWIAPTAGASGRNAVAVLNGCSSISRGTLSEIICKPVWGSTRQCDGPVKRVYPPSQHAGLSWHACACLGSPTAPRRAVQLRLRVPHGRKLSWEGVEGIPQASHLILQSANLDHC